mmetsp:Transcript_114492/g.227861  ORF Transcript_114492/g.227861 Transcript_114492/m.227861 type:complete len:388 (-) Transcript_114492:123-1286(-)
MQTAGPVGLTIGNTGFLEGATMGCPSIGGTTGCVSEDGRGGCIGDGQGCTGGGVGCSTVCNTSGARGDVVPAGPAGASRSCANGVALISPLSNSENGVIQSSLTCRFFALFRRRLRDRLLDLPRDAGSDPSALHLSSKSGTVAIASSSSSFNQAPSQSEPSSSVVSGNSPSRRQRSSSSKSSRSCCRSSSSNSHSSPDSSSAQRLVRRRGLKPDPWRVASSVLTLPESLFSLSQLLGKSCSLAELTSAVLSRATTELPTRGIASPASASSAGVPSIVASQRTVAIEAATADSSFAAAAASAALRAFRAAFLASSCSTRGFKGAWACSAATSELADAGGDTAPFAGCSAVSLLLGVASVCWKSSSSFFGFFWSLRLAVAFFFMMSTQK